MVFGTSKYLHVCMHVFGPHARGIRRGHVKEVVRPSLIPANTVFLGSLNEALTRAAVEGEI